MIDVLIQALGFVLVIIIGFTLKKVKVLEKQDGNILATIIMNVTLPCALLTNATGITINSAMLILLLIGFLSNVFMVGVSYILGKREGKLEQGMLMINCSGYNIGCFVMPFAQAFFPGVGVGYLCMFDVGNSLMCLGGTYALASSVASAGDKLSVKSVCKKLFSSIPFDVYIIIFILSIFNLSIPKPILSITSFIGAGNGFLAMLMIGILLEIKINMKEIKDVLKILVSRVCCNAVFMILVYLFLPVPLLAKKILILALAAPLTTISAVFCRRIGFIKDTPAVANSLSIIISIIELTILIILFV